MSDDGSRRLSQQSGEAALKSKGDAKAARNAPGSWLTSERVQVTEAGRLLSLRATKLGPGDARPAGYRFVYFGGSIWIVERDEAAGATRKRKPKATAIDPATIWTRRFDGVNHDKARDALWGAIAAVGRRLLSGGLAGGNNGDGPKKPKRPPVHPIALMLSNHAPIRSLIGVPVPAETHKPDADKPATMRGLDGAPIVSQQNSWVEVQENQPGRASMVVRIFTRTTPQSLFRAVDEAKEALRAAGHITTFSDVTRATAFNAHVGVIRCIPAPASKGRTKAA